MLIDLLIPYYNNQSRIINCLNSIYYNSDKRVTVTLLNDGCPNTDADFFLNLSKNYKKIKIYHQNNKGVSNARNNLLKKTSSKYIWFVDSDDEIIPSGLLKCLWWLENRSPDTITFYFLSKKGIKVTKTNWLLKFGNFFSASYGNCPSYWFNYGGAYRHIFSRKIIEEKKILFDETLFLGEDALFVASYLQSVRKGLVFKDHFYIQDQTSLGSLSRPLKENYLSSFCNEMKSHKQILAQLKNYKFQKLLFIAQLYRYRSVKYNKLISKNKLSYELLSSIHNDMDYKFKKSQYDQFILQRFPEMKIYLNDN